MKRISEEEIKNLFAEWGLWSLVEDISDDGDGTGDNLQLTKEGSEAHRMIEELLEDTGWQLKKLQEFVEREVEKGEKRGFKKAIDIFEKSKGPGRLIEEWLKYLKK